MNHGAARYANKSRVYIIRRGHTLTTNTCAFAAEACFFRRRNRASVSLMMPSRSLLKASLFCRIDGPAVKYRGKADADAPWVPRQRKMR